MLHRDIYWLGRQWCVTGYGIQAVDKKLNMRFDIPGGQIHDVALSDRLEAEPWFDRADFDEAVEIARNRARNHPGSFQLKPSDER